MQYKNIKTFVNVVFHEKEEIKNIYVIKVISNDLLYMEYTIQNGDNINYVMQWATNNTNVHCCFNTRRPI